MSTPWWESALIYQVYPRSFQDSDGDGVGDLAGIRRRLDHVQWLGADAIWLSPIYPSPLHDWGYDISDHAAIDPVFGDDSDYARLIAEAGERGLRVVMDLVPNHTSIEHEWFREHPDRYVFADPRPDGSPPNNWVAAFGGPTWTRDERSGRLYLHSFFPEQPDLDWRNPEVPRAIADVVRHWIDRGAAGFRLDAIDRIMKDPEFRDDPPATDPFPLPVHPDQQMFDLVNSRDHPSIGEALAVIRAAAGEALLVGEVYLPTERVDPYLDHLDLVFAFDLLHSPFEAEALAGVLQLGAGRRRLAWALSNHDFSRVASRWGPENARAAAVLLLTLPGAAFVYQGEEIGMEDGPYGDERLDRYGRDAFRNPMLWESGKGGGFTDGDPWLPIGSAPAAVAEQRGDAGSLLSLYRRLIRLRRELSGPITGVHARGDVLTLERGDRHMIAVNTGSSAEPMPPGGGLLLQTAADAGAQVLAPHSAAILESGV